MFVWLFPLFPPLPALPENKHIEKLVVSNCVCWLVGQTKSCLHLQSINDYLHIDSHSIYFYSLCFSGTFPHSSFVFSLLVVIDSIENLTVPPLGKLFPELSNGNHPLLALLAGYKFTKNPTMPMSIFMDAPPRGNFAVKGNILSKPPPPPLLRF